MPTSAREEVANSPKASVKAVHSARADVGIGPYRIWCEFAGDFGKSGAVCKRTELSTTTKRVQDRKQAAPILRDFSANLLLLN